MEVKWSEICHIINLHKASSEDLFQTEIVNIFEKLGWSRFNKEIEEKRKIEIGAASSVKPDIIIKNHEIDFFVVELKKPTAKLVGRNGSQLFCYMRQLKLNVGLLINNRIHVFYEDKNCSVPVEIMNVEFNESSEDGPLFLKLFSKQTFNQTTLVDYCLGQLKRLEAIDFITSEDYKNKIMDLIKNDIRGLFDQNVVEMAFKNIDINLTNTLDLTESAKMEGQSNFNSPQEINGRLDEAAEIEKVKRRVPRWLNKSSQTNSRILIKAMKHLYLDNSFSFRLFEKECKDIEQFKVNFDQMANIRDNNHGKVFDKNGDELKLWIPVKEFVKESFSAFKNKKLNNDQI